jgi:hypothetical protein
VNFFKARKIEIKLRGGRFRAPLTSLHLLKSTEIAVLRIPLHHASHSFRRWV